MRTLFAVALLLLVGCTETRFVTVERTNVGNGGNVVVAEFRQGMLDTLTKIENSYRATEYAKRVNVDLRALRSLLDARAYDLVAVQGPLYDKLGGKVHCRVIGRRLEIDENYWEPQFDDGLADEKTKAHELLRLHPDRPADFDDDYVKSISLAAMMTDTAIVVSGLPKGIVVQTAEPSCSASTLEVHWDEADRRLQVSYFQANNKFIEKNIRNYLYYGSFMCGLRLSELPLTEDQMRKLSFSVSTIQYHSRETTIELAVGIRLPRQKEQTYYAALETSSLSDVLKRSTVDLSAFNARKGFRHERSDKDFFVKVQATPWKESNLLIRPESIEIQF